MRLRQNGTGGTETYPECPSPGPTACANSSSLRACSGRWDQPVTRVLFMLGIHGQIEVEREDEAAGEFFNNRQQVGLSTPRETLRVQFSHGSHVGRRHASCRMKRLTSACSTSSRTWVNQPCWESQQDGIRHDDRSFGSLVSRG